MSLLALARGWLIRVGVGILLGVGFGLVPLQAQETTDKDPLAPAPAPAPLKLVELEPLTRENLKRIEELRSEPVGSMTASWRPDGKELLLPLSSSGQEGVEIRDAETLEVLGTTAPGRRVIQIFFNPRLPQVLLVTVNSGVEMVNTETGDGFVFDDLGRGAATLGVSYRPDGKQVAIGGQQGKLFLV
ncbi:MAG: hypothetical protein ACKOFW_10135, partial [Planctomycetaceae bacterium]